MDREIAPEYLQRRNSRRWLMGTVALVLLLTVLYAFRNTLRSSVEASRLRTAVVEVGDVENTLTASGEVIPAYEQIISSPIRAGIKQVLLTPGTRVVPGQAIVELDKTSTQIEFEKMQDQLALKRNSIDQLRMQLNKNLYDSQNASLRPNMKVEVFVVSERSYRSLSVANGPVFKGKAFWPTTSRRSASRVPCPALPARSWRYFSPTAPYPSCWCLTTITC
jgi:multidrug efflux pump subunit AcrA (membrane-fusion protein)